MRLQSHSEQCHEPTAPAKPEPATDRVRTQPPAAMPTADCRSDDECGLAALRGR